MADVTTVEMVRGLYDYHRWANRRLFDHAAGLAPAVLTRDVGAQFSYPTLVRMFGHLYGADSIWLARWKGQSPAAIPGGELGTLAAIRERWDALEKEQKAFVEGLSGADLSRAVEWKNTEGKQFRQPLWPLLQHVANHATHHRSEVATMITMVSGSPPDTGINSYLIARGPA